MATQTERLAVAFLARGFARVEHRSSEPCYKGQRPDGRPIWVWLNRVGGGRWNDQPKRDGDMAISEITIAKILAGKPSKIFA